jgi:hypothetical protein
VTYKETFSLHTFFILAGIIVFIVLPFNSAQSLIIQKASSKSIHSDQNSSDFSGTWVGSLRFEFGDEVVEGSMRLFLTNHSSSWIGEFEMSTKENTGSIQLTDVQIEEDNLFLEILVRENVKFVISGILIENHLTGAIQLYIQNRLVGESPFNLHRQNNFINLFYALAGQRPDPNFKPPINNPAYALGMGPIVLIDEAHNNFHTKEGRYKSFADLLVRDGYVVLPHSTSFAKDTLEEADILVISNALSDRNKNKWALPVDSAFTDEEITYLLDWIRQGGALFLIADHMPFPGAVEALAKELAIEWSNGYAVAENSGGDKFNRSDGTLMDHPVANGREENEYVDSVTTFTGSVFQPREGVELEPILVCAEDFLSYLVKEAGEVTDNTPTIPVGGWLQGAVMIYGKGRVALFGEAAMFPENSKFLLNVLHWLSGLIE